MNRLVGGPLAVGGLWPGPHRTPRKYDPAHSVLKTVKFKRRLQIAIDMLPTSVICAVTKHKVLHCKASNNKGRILYI